MDLREVAKAHVRRRAPARNKAGKAPPLPLAKCVRLACGKSEEFTTRMISALQPGAVADSLPVCPDEKDGVTLCVQCGVNPAKRKFCSAACRKAAHRKSPALCAECGVNPANRKFCSGACRQSAHRKNPAHAACLQRDKDWRSSRRRVWQRERIRSCAINPLVQFSGPSNDAIPRLGKFWISPEGKRMNLPQVFREKGEEK